MPPKPYSLSLKAVVRNEEGFVLLLRRSATSKANAGKWEFPGGKLDAGETVDEALRREVAEETGLVIELSRVLGAGESENPKARVAYLFLEAVAEPGSLCLSPEHDEYAWIPSDRLAQADLAPQFIPFAQSFGG